MTLVVHTPPQEATAVKLWRKAQWVSSEALAKEDTLRRVPPKTQKGPRLLSRGAPLSREESLRNGPAFLREATNEQTCSARDGTSLFMER